MATKKENMKWEKKNYILSFFNEIRISTSTKKYSSIKTLKFSLKRKMPVLQLTFSFKLFSTFDGDNLQRYRFQNKEKKFRSGTNRQREEREKRQTKNKDLTKTIA